MDTFYQIYVGGEFRETDQLLAVINPYNNKELASTYRAGENDIKEAILKALAVQNIPTDLPSWQADEILMQIVALMYNAKTEFTKTISLESGKRMCYPPGESPWSFILAMEKTNDIIYKYYYEPKKEVPDEK